MKILDAGDHPLSNADVLDWVRRKREQHAKEDAENKTKGIKPITRPKNFMTILNRTERELVSDRYPYIRNPSVYGGGSKDREIPFRRFVLDAENTIQDHLEADWKTRLQGMNQQQVDRQFAPVQEMKCLTEPETLMLYNYAPTCVEMLQPMIDNVEERFTSEEQQLLVDVIVKTLRADERKADGMT